MKFREFKTSSDKLVFGGKSAENNEGLINQVKPTEVVLHTAKPGSPFVNIKGRATKKDIQEAAVFCARYSQDWRDNKKDIIVHVFKGKDVYKDKKMKLGTFGVKKHDKIKIKKIDILNFEKRKEKDETN
jgi:predicted ribosome quality control (RQC) complex YloA/Tae2 family protein